MGKYMTNGARNTRVSAITSVRQFCRNSIASRVFIKALSTNDVGTASLVL